MRLSSLCLAAARVTLAVAVTLLFSPATFAQHSGGGSSGGSSSSGSGGGGSHGGSSGGSSSSGSSGSGHSSGASSSSGSSSHSSGGSVSHGSSGHSSSAAPTLSHSTVNDTHSNNVHSVHEPNAEMHARTETPEKRTFFSFLRHPFRKPEPKPTAKPVADLRRPICLRGHCPVCPAGQVRVGGVCGGTVVANNARTFCELGLISNGHACVQPTRFLDDCSAQRIAMERQARNRREADAAQQRACAAGPGLECSDMTGAAQHEADLYRTLQEQYRRCQQRSLRINPFGHTAGTSYSQGLLFDPFEFDLDYR